jgi:hypothetical protein
MTVLYWERSDPRVRGLVAVCWDMMESVWTRAMLPETLSMVAASC